MPDLTVCFSQPKSTAPQDWAFEAAWCAKNNNGQKPLCPKCGIEQRFWRRNRGNYNEFYCGCAMSAQKDGHQYFHCSPPWSVGFPGLSFNSTKFYAGCDRYGPSP